MTSPVQKTHKMPIAILLALCRFTRASAKFIFKLGFFLWAVLALYYSNLPWYWARCALSVGFGVFSLWALWFSSKRSVFAVFVMLYLVLIAWWSTIMPSHDRPWRPEVAVMPRAIVTGDKVNLINVRDFDYRSRTDFTVHYQNREVDLSHLTGLDLFISYWTPGPVGHTFVSFIFNNAPPVSISIETRPEIGEGFSPIASMFKQFELIYVVGDERDLVRVRTNYRDETVYLYHINISPENARKLFLLYVSRINQLADHPEFYHLLSNSCTINILRYANKAGRVGGLNIRHYLNGWIDSYLYTRGWINNTLPFDVLRQKSQINKAAGEANASPDFSTLIRVGLPENHGIRH